MTEYRTLKEPQIRRELFSHFIRRQEVTGCWRKKDGVWQIQDDPFIDDWSEADYEELIRCLKHTCRAGGLVRGAWIRGQLKGFVSVEAEPLGSRGQYLDLSSLHVSLDARRLGIGRALFAAAAQWAFEKGAEKLYISAHSAVESQAFYRSMGCVEAEEYNPEHVQKEPFDCQMVCALPLVSSH